MGTYASHLLRRIRGNALQARLKCLAKCDAILDKLCPEFETYYSSLFPKIGLSSKSISKVSFVLK